MRVAQGNWLVGDGSDRKVFLGESELNKQAREMAKGGTGDYELDGKDDCLGLFGGGEMLS